jgi:hypothetical protein
MGASLLAQPGIDDGLSACCRAGVEHVPDRFLVEPDQREHDLVVGWEPADDPDGDVGVVRMGDPPQLMAAGLPDSLEGRGLLIRLGREVVECFRSATATSRSLPPCSSALVSQRSNPSVQSTITVLV